MLHCSDAYWHVHGTTPLSTEKQNQLASAQIDLVLDCLETIPQVCSEVQLFKVLKISHAEYKGGKLSWPVATVIHSRKAIKSKYWNILICIHMY